MPSIDRAWILDTAERTGLPEPLRAPLADLAAPALTLLPHAGVDGDPPARLGGRPDLPVGADWPTDPRSRPLVFLGQITEAPLREQFAWPEGCGTLSAFVSQSDLGDAPTGEHARVLLHSGNLKRAAPPGGTPEFAEVALRTERIVTIPMLTVLLQRLGLGASSHEADPEWAYLDLHDELRNAQGAACNHQLGGWAQGVQVDDPLSMCVVNAAGPAGHRMPSEEIEREARAWRHLLTVGEWEPRGPSTMDGGAFYFALPLADCARARVDRTGCTTDSS